MQRDCKTLSNATNPAENKILKNWSQNSGTWKTFFQDTSQGLDDTALTVEAKYAIKFIQSEERFELSLQCNWSNSFSFINAAEIYQFKAKDSEMKDYK